MKNDLNNPPVVPFVEFEWQTFNEDDESWDALFVRINEGKWKLAKPIFHTEDEETIRNIIKHSNEWIYDYYRDW